MHELLGSASVFATVVSTIVNEVLGKASGDHALTLAQLRFLELIEQGGEWLDLTDAGDTVLADYRARIESSLIHTLQQESAGQVSDVALDLDRMTRALLDAQQGEPPPCHGCIACNLFRREECPLGTGRPRAACHTGQL